MNNLSLRNRIASVTGGFLVTKTVPQQHHSVPLVSVSKSLQNGFTDADVGVSIYKVGNDRAAEEKWEEALLAWQNALEIFKSSLGDRHVHVARALNKIGVAYYMLDESYYAYDSFEKALALQQEILPPGDEQITRTLRNMNAILSEARESEEEQGSEDEEDEGSEDEGRVVEKGVVKLKVETLSKSKTENMQQDSREDTSEIRCI